MALSQSGGELRQLSSSALTVGNKELGKVPLAFQRSQVGRGPYEACVNVHEYSTVVHDLDEIHHCAAAMDEGVLKL